MEYGKYTAFTAALLLILAGLLTACNGSPDAPEIKIGLVSTEGGFSDSGFNELAHIGFLRAQDEHTFTAEALESSSTEEIRDNIYNLAEQGFDLIITLGYQAAEPVLEAAQDYPDVQFALLDLKVDDPPSNLSTFVYRVDQSAFLCGFLAAWWADSNNSDQAVVGWVGGPPITEIERFRVGYASGVAHYNYNARSSVKVIGEYASGFLDPDEGRRIAGKLIENGASVIFPFAGTTGHGALSAAKEHGIWGIGVDQDLYHTLPEVSDILLTSNMKKLDNTVSALISRFLANDDWGGEPVHFGTLSNGDVDLAPFHDFESEVPDSIRQQLSDLREAIINGQQPTGWSR